MPKARGKRSDSEKRAPAAIKPTVQSFRQNTTPPPPEPAQKFIHGIKPSLTADIIVWLYCHPGRTNADICYHFRISNHQLETVFSEIPHLKWKREL